MISPETRMMGLPYGEEIMIVGRTMWTQCTCVTDGRTDGRTELRSQRPCNAERRTVKIRVILLNKYEIGDGKYSKISNNCARFESNTEVTIRFEISNIRTARLSTNEKSLYILTRDV